MNLEAKLKARCGDIIRHVEAVAPQTNGKVAMADFFAVIDAVPVFKVLIDRFKAITEQQCSASALSHEAGWTLDYTVQYHVILLIYSFAGVKPPYDIPNWENHLDNSIMEGERLSSI